MMKNVARIAVILVLAACAWALIRSADVGKDVEPRDQVPVVAAPAPADVEPPEPPARVGKARRAGPRLADPSSSRDGELMRASAPVVIPPDPDDSGLEHGAVEPGSPSSHPAPVEHRDAAAVPPAPDAAPVPIGVPADPALPFGAVATEEDAVITVNVRRKLEGAVPGRRIQVTTRQGVVTLSGAVDTEQEKTQALEAARQTSGVDRVDDRIVVLIS